jgi:hypothetical protein
MAIFSPPLSMLQGFAGLPLEATSLEYPTLAKLPQITIGLSSTLELIRVDPPCVLQ